MKIQKCLLQYNREQFDEKCIIALFIFIGLHSFTNRAFEALKQLDQTIALDGVTELKEYHSAYNSLYNILNQYGADELPPPS